MKNIIFSVLLMGAIGWLTPPVAFGANHEAHMMEQAQSIASPHSALLSPASGRLEVKEQLEVIEEHGKSIVKFLLPANSANLQISIPGHTINRWSMDPEIVDNSGKLSEIRRQIRKEEMELSAKLVALKARLALWQALPQDSTAQEIAQMQNLMSQDIPSLVAEQELAEDRLKLVRQELMEMPQTAEVGQKVTVTLADRVEVGKHVGASYSYDHPACGWQAVYNFNARPDDDGVIDVRLLAEVWQYTGINWNGTKITLSTRSGGPRQPAPLADWVVDSAASPKPQPRAMMLNARSDKAVAAMGAMPESAPVIANSDAVYATWTLEQTGLPEGRCRVSILADVWKSPFQWLARPNRYDDMVWMFVKHQLPANQAWPVGQAEYSVNGASVGNGEFRPSGGEATLYFGADPRVHVRTTIDNRKHGESGFINTSKNWTWAWTYTITNDHSRPVKVRVERPLPQIVDETVKVTYDNKPQAKQDTREHMFYWDVEAPAHGKTEIHHGVTITSPTKLPLLPDVP